MEDAAEVDRNSWKQQQLVPFFLAASRPPSTPETAFDLKNPAIDLTDQTKPTSTPPQLHGSPFFQQHHVTLIRRYRRSTNSVSPQLPRDPRILESVRT